MARTQRHEQDAGRSGSGPGSVSAPAGLDRQGTTPARSAAPTDVAAKPTPASERPSRVSDMLKRQPLQPLLEGEHGPLPIPRVDFDGGWRVGLGNTACPLVPEPVLHRQHETALRTAGHPLEEFPERLAAADLCQVAAADPQACARASSNSIESIERHAQLHARSHAHHVAVSQQLVAHVARQLQPADTVLRGWIAAGRGLTPRRSRCPRRRSGPSMSRASSRV